MFTLIRIRTHLMKYSGWALTTLASTSAGRPTANPPTSPSWSWKVKPFLKDFDSILPFPQENFTLQCSLTHLAISSFCLGSIPFSSSSFFLSSFPLSRSSPSQLSAFPHLVPFSDPLFLLQKYQRHEKLISKSKRAKIFFDVIFD